MRRPSELNLPNSITIFRILALPLCVYVLFKNGGHDYHWRIAAWWVFFAVGMSDALDGKLARSRHSITEFGKLLDPIADKAFIATAMIGLCILGDFQWWITALIMSREIGITIFRFSVIKRGIIPANRGGKVKAVVQNFAVSFYMLPLSPSLYLARDIFLGIAIVITLATGASYIQQAQKK